MTVAYLPAGIYEGRRSPVFARNIVSTSQPLASQAGLKALAAGGNAIDAALAAAITLTVVEPTSNGIGSDLFCIVWDGQALHGLNASGRISDEVAAELADRGHEIVREAPDTAFGFGGAQLVRRIEGGYVAGSDPRKDGQSVGF